MENQENSRKVRICLLEDDPLDAELEISALEKAGYICSWERVETQEAFRTLLQSSTPFDLILADYNLPSFDGLSALRLYQELQLNIPFILVSGAVGEEFAIESLKAGATDYVIKDRLYRLGPVVKRALLEFESIKARQQAEKEAQKAYQQRNELINSIEGIVWEVDLNTRTLLFISAQAERLFGFPVQDWLKEPNFWEKHLHLDDREEVENEIEQTIQHGNVLKLEYRMLAKNGRIVWIQDIITPVKEAGIVQKLRGIMVDITHRKKIEAALKQSEARLKDAQKMALIGSWEWSLPTDEIIWSDGMFDIYGIEKTDKPDILMVRNLILEEDLPIFDNAFLRIEEGIIPEKIEYRIRTKDGELKHITSNARFELNERGEIIGLKGTVQDISERKQLEEQLRLSQKMDAIGQFTAGVAHDFNNILSSINGTSELMDRRISDDDPLKKSIKRIRFAGDKAANLVQQLMTFSHKHVFEIKPIDLNAIISDMDDLLRHLIGEDIELNIVLSEELWMIQGDSTQIEQIIINLSANARDAMPNGGQLTIKAINQHQVNLDNFSIPFKSNYVLLIVEDTGHGIEKTDQEREPFFTTKEVGKGTGLGLATAYGVVQKLNGEIKVQSEVGEGTRILIYLPQSNQPSEVKSSITSHQDNISGSETILLVEDDTQVKDLVVELLSSKGYNVIEAKDGIRAITLSNLYQEEIDLLLTDVIMPKMNGPELADILCHSRPNLKVIYMSGYADSKLAPNQTKINKASFIQKPFSNNTLLQKIHDALHV